MYFKTIEEEQEFLWSLWQVFDDWVIKNHKTAKPGTEVVECDLLCPVCKTGRIINYGIVEENHNGLHSFGMRHVCEHCHEEFDRIKVNEDIYNHTPFTMLEELETPVGKFRVFRNDELIPFHYRTVKTDIEGIELTKHLIDVDTSFMKQGDKVFAGIKGAGLVYRDGGEQCTYRSAENEECFLVLNGEYIDDYEVDIEDYSFISEYEDEDGFAYLIHRNPEDYREVVSRFCRTISFCIAWGQKDLCENYEDVIEQAAW